MKKLAWPALLLCLHAEAKSPQEQNWQLLETEHFRLMFPKEFQGLAQNASHELEQSRALVLKQQQRQLAKKTDVVLLDPDNAPNGFALPLSHTPTMALFATAPQSDSALHHLSGWMQLVALHEYIHLVHLAQPERSEWRDKLNQLSQLSDLTRLDTPRWVSEGYATLQESKLTGKGRLYSAYAEAWLQQLAQEGALPRYNELNIADGRYQARGFAYLVGARFLAWLEQNYGVEKLDTVWTRQVAIKNRSFDQAFEGVYGVSAQTLYQRFVAEYSFQSMQQQQQLQPLQAKLWLNSKGRQQSPALSPDGTLLAVVTDDSRDQSQLQVFLTADNQKAREKFQQSQKELLENDKQDIVDTEPASFNPEQKYLLEQRNFTGMRDPRWLNAETLVFGANTKDQYGNSQQDLFLWHLPSGEVKALSQNAGLRRFDVSPDGRFIIAERQQAGYAALVRLDIATGDIQPLTEAELEKIYDFPRISPNQQQFAVLHFAPQQGWQLQLRDLKGQLQQLVPMPDGYQYLSYPNWSTDGKSLFFVASQQGRLCLYRYDLSSKKLWQLTQGAEMVQMPVPMKNGSLLLQLVNQQGPDLYLTEQFNAVEVTRFAGNTASEGSWLLAKNSIKPAVGDIASQTHTRRTDTAPVQNHLRMPEVQVHQEAPVGASQQPYGVGPQQQSLTLHYHFSNFTPDAIGIALKGGDPVKMLDYQLGVQKDLSHNDFSAAFGAVRYQGWPVKVLLSLQQSRLDLSGQQNFELGLEKQKSALLQLSFPWRAGEWQFDQQLQLRELDLTGSLGNGELLPDDHNSSASLVLSQSWQHQRNSWGLGFANSFSYHQSAGDSWRGVDWSPEVQGRWQDWILAAEGRWQRRWQQDALLRLGGFSSAAMTAAVDPNRILSSELAFATLQGQDYRRYQLSLAHQSMPPLRLLYRRHQFAGTPDLDTYGVAVDMPLSFGVGPVSLSDLQLDLGLFRISPEGAEQDTALWLHLGYQF
ncbi:MAG TPA: hypothetical protein DF774_11315 [Rheinheimera sp.]|uniref:TolB family protein n=1 Tax=Rheinheimera sp. TaxID=1869214 RepID=UPI000EC2DAEA|nr:hypothetical protein [Rheinheimera sp.]HCU66337.1 hypothetical protein [Rheinheimera sp.]